MYFLIVLAPKYKLNLLRFPIVRTRKSKILLLMYTLNIHLITNASESNVYYDK